ncbi:MAG: UDP-glucose 6-dehydrogenase [Alphaproteobacteria bacterium]|nr:UDP-glucose 6-dehydrogenase [Alphaproteobacteria bacterium]
MKQSDIKVGIIGYGVIGSTFSQWLKEHTQCRQAISDPPKGINEDLTGCNVFFVGIHIPTEADGTQDLTLLKQIISNLPQGPVFIRTTLLPGTADKLTNELMRPVYFMPEFLTERTAYADFCSQDVVITGEHELMDAIFANKKRLYMSNIEAELTKYAHNVFGAVAVTYFNGIYDLCQKAGAEYEKVRQGLLLSGYIAPTHSHVPGPDGKFGYGGKCFPKDVNAFTEYSKGSPLFNLLESVINANKVFRN